MASPIDQIIQDHYGSKTAQTYDEIAYKYFWGYAEALKSIGFHLAYSLYKEGRLSQPLEIVDLGAGTGNLSYEIAEILLEFAKREKQILNLNFHLVDSSIEMLNVAETKIKLLGRKFGEYEQVKCNLISLPLQEWKKAKLISHFDFAVSSFAIHHLSEKEKKDLFLSIYRNLKTGGRFYFADRVISETKSTNLQYTAAVASRFLAATNSYEENISSLTNKIQDQFDNDGDQPSTLQEQLAWLAESGFHDLSVLFKALPTMVITGQV